MVLTAQDANRIKQGIHIKGVNFTLTAVKLKSNDGEYTTMAEDLFDWKNMLLSGATQGLSCIVGLKAYGGVGWYWPEKVDLSGYGCVVIELLQPAAEMLTVQLLYDQKGVKRQNIIKGSTRCKLLLNTTHKNVYSLNIISEKAQTVAIGSVNLTDKQGNVVPTSIDEQSILASRILSVEYYNTAGVRLNLPQPGINIVKINLEGGRVIVRKELKCKKCYALGIPVTIIISIIKNLEWWFPTIAILYCLAFLWASLWIHKNLSKDTLYAEDVLSATKKVKRFKQQYQRYNYVSYISAVILIGLYTPTVYHSWSNPEQGAVMVVLLWVIVAIMLI